MIVTKLNGGIGNQLFQYAIGRSLAIHNDTDLKLDISAYSSYFRPYLLSNFNIVENYLSESEAQQFKKYQKRFSMPAFLEYLKPTATRVYRKEHQNDYFLFNRNLFVMRKTQQVYLDGYWQNEKYFLDIKDTILKEFKLKKEGDLNSKPIITEIKNSDSVSIHFRRTDYLSKQIYNTLHPDYYQQAAEIVVNKVSNPHFFIFSDDIGWVRENFKLNFPTTYVSNDESLDVCQELVAMSKCKHNIIANSSFSWWAAWLNTHQNKIVIAPSKWMNSSGYQTEDLLPKNWVKL